VATPFENVIVVEAPSTWAKPVLSVTVGAVTGELDEPAPANVSAWSPVYEVAVLPNGSRAVCGLAALLEAR
jgi:hypothetical protein